MIVSATVEHDIPALQSLVEETGMFPPEMVPDLLSGFLAGETGQVWLSCTLDTGLAGFCYAAEETLAEGSWNMLAIGVSRAMQRNGVGSSILEALEDRLRGNGARILIAETSGLPEFEAARAFYDKAGYQLVARIGDFWADGDDKIVFWKSLRA